MTDIPKGTMSKEHHAWLLERMALAKQRRAEEKARREKVERQSERAKRLKHERDPHVMLYRLERAKAEKRDAKLLKAAKRQFDAQMAKEEQGRLNPKTGKRRWAFGTTGPSEDERRSA